MNIYVISRREQILVKLIRVSPCQEPTAMTEKLLPKSEFLQAAIKVNFSCNAFKNGPVRWRWHVGVNDKEFKTANTVNLQSYQFHAQLNENDLEIFLFKFHSQQRIAPDRAFAGFEKCEWRMHIKRCVSNVFA